YGASLPNAVIRAGMSTAEALAEARARAGGTRGNMIAAQEELDWQCYHLYGLADADLQYNGTPPPLKLGERAFEIVMARKVAAGPPAIAQRRSQPSRATGRTTTARSLNVALP